MLNKVAKLMEWKSQQCSKKGVAAIQAIHDSTRAVPKNPSPQDLHFRNAPYE